MNFTNKVLSLYVLAETQVWYHGRTSTSTEFDPKFTGKGNDQEGPGFYFSSDLKDASSYAYPNGIVIKAELHLRKFTPDKPNRLDIHTLMRAAPDLADTLTNWDENPEKAFKQAFDVIMKIDDPYQQVWIDFYKNHPAEYLKNMAQLGYDGHESKMPKGVRHLVVYNPKAIKILDIIPYKETDIKAASKLYMYHVTSADRWDKIKKEGLIPRKEKRGKGFADSKPAIYLFLTKDEAEDGVMNWLGDHIQAEDEDGSDSIIVLRVDMTGIKYEEDPELPLSSALTYEKIAPNRLKVETT